MDRKWTWSKVGHNVSHIIDTRQRNIVFVNQDQMRIRGGLKIAKVNFSWTYWWHDTGFGSIWHQKIRGHDDKAKSRWEVKMDYPNPWRQAKNEMRCPQPETNSYKCHVQERHTADTTMILVSFFPHHFWRVPLYFYTSLKRIPYACHIIFSFGQIKTSTFNEP